MRFDKVIAKIKRCSFSVSQCIGRMHKGPFIATQLNSTSSRVELCRYKRAFTDTGDRPVASVLIMGDRFPQILDPFQGLKIGVPSGCLGETSIFKIIIIDDVTLWSKLESTW